MTTASMRRLPMRMMDSPQSVLQDENAMPTASCSASPSKLGPARSPSKMPTLSDIAARLNRDREASTPGSSPIKQMLSPSSDSLAARPRLELTGRITGSPKPPQQGERKSPLVPTSPLKTFDEQTQPTCLSPTALSSGATSPTKRMLAKGLPSLEEIRDRMSRKGLTAVNDGSSPTMDGTSLSPAKISAGSLAQSPEIKTASPEKASAPLPSVESDKENKAAFTATAPGTTTITAKTAGTKPILHLSTKVGMVSSQKLNHPLPAPPPKAPTHPLQHEWTLYFDTRNVGPSTPGLPPPSPSVPAPPTPTLSSSSWEANLRTIGAYSTVESFLGCFAKLHRPSQLERHSSYHLFKDSIKPMWEDPRNANGGKWTITFRQRNPALVDRSWLWLVLGLIGEEMDGEDETCGAVCSVKPRGDRISLWVKNKEDTEAVNRIGRKLIALLELGKEPGLLLEFNSHEAKYDDPKQEGIYYSINNAVQPMARTPTFSTFAAAGLPNADAAKLAAAAANSSSMLTAASPSSPNGKSSAHFRGQQAPRSPVAVSPHTSTSTSAESQPFGRLSGQPNSGCSPHMGAMLGKSPNGAASPSNFGALGQSLGLGINTNSAGSISPSVGAARRNPFQQGAVDGGGAMSWRASSNRGSVSPQRSNTFNSARSRSTSPSKA